MVKLNNSDDYESVMILLTPEKTPIAYQHRVDELINCGTKERDAKILALEPIELEIYYEQDCGLFGVDSGAVESGTIYSPYSGELCEY